MAKRRRKKANQITHIYKYVGIAVAILLIIGILYASMTGEEPETPAPMEEITSMDDEPAEPVAEPEPENVTEKPAENITAEPETSTTPENMTEPENATTPEPTNETQANQTAPASQTETGAREYKWEDITIAFPDNLTTVPRAKNSYHYFNITEADGSPVANDEQFKITFTITSPQGQPSTVLTNYEKEQWLIRLTPSSAGTYQLSITVTCKDQQGYCQRLYGEGSQEASQLFDVV